MNLEALTRSPAWIVAGWTMLHFLWVAAIIGGAAVAGRWALRSAGSNVRYAFALVCLGALALAPVVIAARVIHHRVGSPVSLPAGTIVMFPADSPPDGYSSREKLAGGVEAQPPGPFPESVAVPVNANRQPLAVWMASAAEYLPWLWIVGSPIVFLTLATGLMGAERLRRQSRVLDTPDWRNTCHRLAERLKVRRAVAIATCEHLVSPILVGIVRPLILLPPAALTGWTPEQVEMVLLHELAHVRRWDNLVNLLQRIVESLLFFHPVVWLVSGWVRREREHCCDELVLQATGKRRAYAETLAALAMPSPLVHRAAVAMGEHNVVARIRRILKLEESTMRPSGKLVVFAAIVLLAPALMLAVRAGQQDAAESPTEPGRILRFPADRTMGVVFTRVRRADGYDAGNQYDDWKRVAEARGRVSVPSDADVRLDISAQASTDLSGLDKLRPDDVQAIFLKRTDLDDDGLKHVGRLVGLRFLDLEQTRITDKGIRHLQPLVNLEQIDLDGFRVVEEGFGVGDDGVAVLSRLPKLKRLTVRRSNVTDAGLIHLRGNKSIRILSLGGTRVTDAGLVSLTSMANLQYLELGVYRQGAKVTDIGMPTLGRITTLTSLDLSGTEVTDNGLVHLRALVNLESLDISNTAVTTVGLAELKHFTRLKRLRMNGTRRTVRMRGEAMRGDVARHLAAIPSLETISANLRLTDADLVHMAKLSNLQRLSLSGEDVTDAGVEHIAKMKSLKSLWFQRCPITDQGLERIKGLKSLERLMLHDTHVTDEGLRHLRNHPSLWWLAIRFGEGALPENRKESALRHLSGLETLTWLDIGGTDVQNEDLSAIAQMQGLESLEFHDLVVDNTGVQHLENLTSLKRLDLDKTTITDEGLRFIAGLVNLEYLTISGFITDQGAKHLATLRSLQLLQIGSPYLTNKGVATLKSSIPGLQRVNHFPYRLGGSVASVSDKDPILRRGRKADRTHHDSLEGRPSPPIRATTWTNTGGRELSLADLAGRVVLVQFWSVRCSNRRASMQDLKQIHAAYTDKGLAIISIHPARNGDRMVDFIQSENIAWPVAVDVDDTTKDLFHADSCPATYFLIDHLGTMRFADVHKVHLERAVETLLHEIQPN